MMPHGITRLGRVKRDKWAVREEQYHLWSYIDGNYMSKGIQMHEANAKYYVLSLKWETHLISSCVGGHELTTEFLSTFISADTIFTLSLHKETLLALEEWKTIKRHSTFPVILWAVPGVITEKIQLKSANSWSKNQTLLEEGKQIYHIDFLYSIQKIRAGQPKNHGLIPGRAKRRFREWVWAVLESGHISVALENMCGHWNLPGQNWHSNGEDGYWWFVGSGREEWR
jgi:hypothetical protein